MKKETGITGNKVYPKGEPKSLSGILMDYVREVICVVDPNTYEVLFANKTLKDMTKKDITGGLCYNVLHKKDSPCTFCAIAGLKGDSGGPLYREVHNSILKRDFSIASRLIKWPDGRDVVVECAIDITRNKKAESDLKRRLEIERVVKDASARFIGIHNFNDSINRALAEVGRVSTADRVYLCHFQKDGTVMANTHQWCADNIEGREDRFLIYKVKDFPWWMEKLHNNDIIYIENTGNLPDEAKAERESFRDQGVVSVLALPFDVNGELYGYIGFQNFSRHGGWETDDISILRLFAEIVGNAFERRSAEQMLRESGDRYRTIFESTGTATILCDEDMTVSLVSTEFEKLTGYPRYQLEGIKKVTGLFNGIEAEKIKKHYNLRKNGYDPVPGSMETWINDRFQNKKHLIVNISFLPDSSKSIFSFQDITERKIAEQKLEYLGFHDSLTGLYNRAFFEEKMKCFEEQKLCPAAVVMCDFDGLKSVNDSLGHDGGDRLLVAIADILKKTFRPEDIIARVGGDEFAVLLPRDNGENAEVLSRRIIKEANEYSDNTGNARIHVSVSYAARVETSKSMRDVYIEADNSMYREKLHHVKSSRSAVVQTLGKALEARDFITEGHTERIQSLVVYLAEAVGSKRDRLADLRLFAKFHDIGKIGISDSILFKKGPLTHEERRQMKLHSQIGSSIAMSSPDLRPIAEWILKHHEWWNGKGYPLGIKKEKIPLECRMLAIADAYDAMTNDRPYRKAMSCSEAVQELKRCAGTQFDPYLVERFVLLPVIKNSVKQPVK